MPDLPRTKPILSIVDLAQMNLGFLGLQFNFGLQQSNMSPIYNYLGTCPDSGVSASGYLCGDGHGQRCGRCQRNSCDFKGGIHHRRSPLDNDNWLVSLPHSRTSADTGADRRHPVQAVDSHGDAG